MRAPTSIRGPLLAFRAAVPGTASGQVVFSFGIVAAREGGGHGLLTRAVDVVGKPLGCGMIQSTPQRGAAPCRHRPPRTSHAGRNRVLSVHEHAGGIAIPDPKPSPP